MDGLLLVDKPSGWTSFDVVAKVRGLLRQSGIAKPKVGHTGTLDPLATGLLLLVIGSYCKRAQEFTKLDKTYQVTAILGQTSTTGDDEGQKTTVQVAKEPTKGQVEAAITQLTGSIQQTPPAFSAIKVGGKRAYQLARAGKPVKIEPRVVTIHEFTEVKYSYPELSFTVSVSSGTYIRTLVEDIGQLLGTGAYTSKLRRLSVGDYEIADSLELTDLTAQKIQDHLSKVAPN